MVLIKSRKYPRKRNATRKPGAARRCAIRWADTAGIGGGDTSQCPTPDGIQPWHSRADGADCWQERHSKNDRSHPISEARSVIERSCSADLTMCTVNGQIGRQQLDNRRCHHMSFIFGSLILQHRIYYLSHSLDNLVVFNQH